MNSTSFPSGIIGFLVINLTLALPPHTHIGNPGGHLQAVAKSLNLVFTSLSSREWKVIIPRCV